MLSLFNFGATGTLASTVSATQTTIPLSTGQGARFTLPSGGYTFVTLRDGSKREVVKLTAVAGDVLTVVRGQDGTQAMTHAAGICAAIEFTPAMLQEQVPPASPARPDPCSPCGDPITGACAGISATGFPLADMVAGTLYDKTIYLSGTTPYALTFTAPSWLAVYIEDNKLRIKGTPPALTTSAEISVQMSNCGGSKVFNTIQRLTVTAPADAGAEAAALAAQVCTAIASMAVAPETGGPNATTGLITENCTKLSITRLAALISGLLPGATLQQILALFSASPVAAASATSFLATNGATFTLAQMAAAICAACPPSGGGGGGGGTTTVIDPIAGLIALCPSDVVGSVATVALGSASAGTYRYVTSLITGTMTFDAAGNGIGTAQNVSTRTASMQASANLLAANTSTAMAIFSADGSTLLGYRPITCPPVPGGGGGGGGGGGA